MFQYVYILNVCYSFVYEYWFIVFALVSHLLLIITVVVFAPLLFGVHALRLFCVGVVVKHMTSVVLGVVWSKYM